MDTPKLYYWTDEKGQRPLSALTKKELIAALIETADDAKNLREASAKLQRSMLQPMNSFGRPPFDGARGTSSAFTGIAALRVGVGNHYENADVDLYLQNL
jgi:hypothetical protein